MSKRNFISSLVVLVFFIAFYVLSLQLGEDAAYWPKLICVVGAVLAILNAVSSGLQMRKEQTQAPLFPLSAAQIKNGLILLGVAAAWIFCISVIGYLVSAILATGVLVLVFEPVKDKKHILRDVVVTLFFSCVIYLLFALLGVHFPKGLLI